MQVPAQEFTNDDYSDRFPTHLSEHHEEEQACGPDLKRASVKTKQRRMSVACLTRIAMMHASKLIHRILRWATESSIETRHAPPRLVSRRTNCGLQPLLQDTLRKNPPS